MHGPSRQKRVVVFGIMGQMPFAGMAWQVLQYLEGFRRLGWCVHYVEDTGQWPYDPERQTVTDDPAGEVAYIQRMMEWVGLKEQWAYRSGVDGRIFGLTDSGLSAVLAAADVLLNVCGATVLREEHLAVHDLAPEHSLLVQSVGLGSERKLGCGIFVPHRLAAAVGSA